MENTKEKIVELFKVINKKNYLDVVQKDLTDLPKVIGDEIKISEVQAMALLGFLISNKYIKIDNKKGVYFPEEDETTRLAIEEIMNEKIKETGVKVG